MPTIHFCFVLLSLLVVNIHCEADNSKQCPECEKSLEAVLSKPIVMFNESICSKMTIEKIITTTDCTVNDCNGTPNCRQLVAVPKIQTVSFSCQLSNPGELSKKLFSDQPATEGDLSLDIVLINPLLIIRFDMNTVNGAPNLRRMGVQRDQGSIAASCSEGKEVYSKMCEDISENPKVLEKIYISHDLLNVLGLKIAGDMSDSVTKFACQ